MNESTRSMDRPIALGNGPIIVLTIRAPTFGQVIERPDVFQKLHFKHNKMIRGWVGQGVFTADDDEEVRASAAAVECVYTVD